MIIFLFFFSIIIQFNNRNVGISSLTASLQFMFRRRISIGMMYTNRPVLFLSFSTGSCQLSHHHPHEIHAKHLSINGGLIAPRIANKMHKTKQFVIFIQLGYNIFIIQSIFCFGSSNIIIYFNYLLILLSIIIIIFRIATDC